MAYVGCTGEGIIATGCEIETGPAATLWAAHLPGATVSPLRLSFSNVHDQFSLQEWPDLEVTGSARPVLLLFADPFSTPMQDVLSLIEERYPYAMALGGLAEEDRTSEKTVSFWMTRYMPMGWSAWP